MARLHAGAGSARAAVWHMGRSSPLPDALTLACQEAAQGLPAMVRTLEADERDPLASSLARLGRAMGIKG